MTGKNFSIIITVDSSCCRCHDKMKKILCECEGRWCIQSVVWDKKENKITLTGPFCPDELAKELRRKAGDCIKDIKTVVPVPPGPCGCRCKRGSTHCGCGSSCSGGCRSSCSCSSCSSRSSCSCSSRSSCSCSSRSSCSCSSCSSCSRSSCGSCSSCSRSSCSSCSSGGCGSSGAHPPAHVPSYGRSNYDGCRVEFFCEEEPSCRPM